MTMEESSPPVYAHILDLPQLYTRPSSSVLLSTLALFAAPPPSWDTPSPSSPATQSTHLTPPPGFSQYLTSIIASSLKWIKDEDEVEKVKEMAATRLAERCGRSARPGMVREVRVPVYQSPHGVAMVKDAVGKVCQAPGSVEVRNVLPTPPESGTATPMPSLMDARATSPKEITIHLNEPSLTADNLGLKTWCSSHLLSRLLPLLKSTSPNLLPHHITQGRVLELGAGTGLVGMAAAASGVVESSGEVVVTDLTGIVENLRRNVEINRERGVLRDSDTEGDEHDSNPTAKVSVRVLDWCDYSPSSLSPSSSSDSTPSTTPKESPYPFILAADPLYSPSHPTLLANVVARLLDRKTPGARFIAEMPLREGYDAERKDFRERMQERGLKVLGEGVDTGKDDWGDDGGREVKCWWSVWAWE
ncbi:hypothetical protein EX30DRAFT_345245 [Ascodesmis nigricans]|uniref:S-adenosyl-L-methionine-dependent methyltransferase n=1 Tax=Ascodesmis nigricans TaxID=341454 RepID=A0A4S2N5H0_9PEZI|nr:hypothetical protein EX30DRAFT_345245 [Ascodesmis nigricans]